MSQCYCCEHGVSKSFDGMHSKYIPASGITVDVRCPCTSNEFFDTLETLRSMMTDQREKGES